MEAKLFLETLAKEMPEYRTYLRFSQQGVNEKVYLSTQQRLFIRESLWRTFESSELTPAFAVQLATYINTCKSEA